MFLGGAYDSGQVAGPAGGFDVARVQSVSLPAAEAAQRVPAGERNAGQRDRGGQGAGGGQIQYGDLLEEQPGSGRPLRGQGNVIVAPRAAQHRGQHAREATEPAAQQRPGSASGLAGDGVTQTDLPPGGQVDPRPAQQVAQRVDGAVEQQPLP